MIGESRWRAKAIVFLYLSRKIIQWCPSDQAVAGAAGSETREDFHKRVQARGACVYPLELPTKLDTKHVYKRTINESLNVLTKLDQNTNLG